jgi:hypothetical protein
VPLLVEGLVQGSTGQSTQADTDAGVHKLTELRVDEVTKYHMRTASSLPPCENPYIISL